MYRRLLHDWRESEYLGTFIITLTPNIPTKKEENLLRFNTREPSYLQARIGH